MSKGRAKRRWAEAGDAYLLPLADGRFGLCRVLRTQDAGLGIKRGALVELSAWIGAEAPALDDLALREPLLETHHSHAGSPARIWETDPPPPSLQLLGSIEVREAEGGVECLTFGFWEDLGESRLTQWRWDHERESLLAEEAAAEAAERAREAAEEAAASGRRPPTLANLRRRKPFKSWQGQLPAAAVDASRAVIKDCLAALKALGKSPAPEEAWAVIRSGVERFNQLDGELLSIETAEREEIAEWFGLIAAACGLAALGEDVTEPWREW